MFLCEPVACVYTQTCITSSLKCVMFFQHVQMHAAHVHGCNFASFHHHYIIIKQSFRTFYSSHQSRYIRLLSSPSYPDKRSDIGHRIKLLDYVRVAVGMGG